MVQDKGLTFGAYSKCCLFSESGYNPSSQPHVCLWVSGVARLEQDINLTTTAQGWSTQ